MDCSICYEDINDTTGKTVLSCGHTFHIRCVGKWICANSSCPNCRKGLGETEAINDSATEESVSLRDEDEVYEDLEGVEFRWQRVGDRVWQLLEVVDDERNKLAALRIQAWIRGCLVRQQLKQSSL